MPTKNNNYKDKDWDRDSSMPLISNDLDLLIINLKVSIEKYCNSIKAKTIGNSWSKDCSSCGNYSIKGHCIMKIDELWNKIANHINKIIK